MGIASSLSFGIRRTAPTPAAPSAKPVVEPLEDRIVMAAGPVVTSVIADNRGQVDLRFDRALDRDTVTTSSVRILTAGDDERLGTADDERERLRLQVRSRRIIATARNLDADTRYRLLLRSSLIEDTDGNRLDGEFNGANQDSGDGDAGGNYLIEARVAATPVARFTTSLGVIDVELFEDDAPRTVRNFLRYANSGDWDNSIFHRSVDNFIIQGGGFDLDSDDLIGNVRQRDPVRNEPGISNTRGTLAMAKVSGQPDSATNQWFFNCDDNGGAPANLDTQNEGFTVFGEITNGAGRRVMDAINDLNTVDAGGAFSDLPVTDANLDVGINVDRARDLVVLQRVAILMRVRGV